MPVRRGTNPGARETSADSPRRAVGRSSPHPQATTPGGRKWIAHFFNFIRFVVNLNRKLLDQDGQPASPEAA